MSVGNLHMLLASTSYDLFRIQSNAFGWGENDLGQLGNETTLNKSSPVFVSGGIKNWTEISSSPVGKSVLAIRADGTAWGWGSNARGQLGDNTTVNKSYPVSVVGGFTDWTDVSAGGLHGLGVRSNGTAWAWGGGTYGRLGDNTTTDKSSPVSVVGGFTDWTQVSGGPQHSLGVRSNGTAWAWGGGSQGKLGDGTTVGKSSPVSVVGGFTDWTQVSAGNSHSLGVRSNGTAWAWGSNAFGRLGDNTTIARSSPVSVVGGITNWTQVSAGLYHSAGVRSSGGIWTWGNGSAGRLGNNSTIARSSPVAVVGGISDWTKVSAGIVHTAAVRSSGTAWAWGFNGLGALGNNSTVDRSSPVSVVGGVGDWVSVTTGDSFVIGIRQPSISPGFQLFSTPGTTSFTVPTGVTSVNVVAIGGGGGGQVSRGGSSGSERPSSGGGGGGLAWKNNISVIPGASYTVVVGAGGAGGTIVGDQVSTSVDGSNGSASYFISTGTVRGDGGFAGAAGGGSGGSFVGDGGGTGGSGASRTDGGFDGGGGGGSGGYSGNGGWNQFGTGLNPDTNSGGGGAGASREYDPGVSGGFTSEGGSGGGVGVHGLNADGVGGGSAQVSGLTTAPSGTAGSLGSGQTYGGGGGGAMYAYFDSGSTRTAPAGGNGAVLIRWGPGTEFPNYKDPASY